jgi:ABC-2 type transport system permease protein
MSTLLQMLLLIVIDAAIVAVLALALLPLKVYKRAAYAVTKRNFIGYFSNPTGYVFLCIFVILTTSVAFLMPQFFASNLANLDQLNYWLPAIMLVYIPSITMSIWAEERRQGTDELLLTLPADDFDIVIGKYLAAAAIYTAALLFSQLSNMAVLVSLSLGNVDIGMLYTTYLGYWLMGLAMLALGMVASFLTSNLTVGFILGVVFNVPLVAATYADLIIPSYVWAQRIKQLGIAAYLDDFGRGVISFGGVLYFLLVIVVGIYLSMVLVGRRHWYGGRDGESLLGHYLVRIVSLIVVAFSANVLFAYYDPVRIDTTQNQVSSLSSATTRLIRNLDTKQPILIEAYISTNIPDQYMKVRHDLISMLKELERLGGSKLKVNIYDNVDPYSERAQKASDRYGIKSQRVSTESRSRFRDDEIILGAAFTSGLEKVVIPFFDYGASIEYELVRSIATVARGERYTIGVVQTDAQMMGGMTFNMMSPQSTPKRAIINELELQYKVEQVDPSKEIEADKFDALLLVQPSSLTPQQLPNVLKAIEDGVPTAVFEDPLPVFMRGVTPTGMPKPPPGGMFGGGGPPPEKCDLSQMWSILGMTQLGRVGDQTGMPQGPPLFQPEVVWQAYNPYPNLEISSIGPEFVYVRDKIPTGTNNVFVSGFDKLDSSTKGLEEVLFPFPGALKRVKRQGLDFTKLAITSGDLSGSYPFNKWMETRSDNQELEKARGQVSGEKVIAARIKGTPADATQKMADDEKKPAVDKKKTDSKNTDKKGDGAKTDEKPKREGIHVVYVADIDLLGDEFLGIRARPDRQLEFRFDNVTFVLNVLDSLVGDERFIDIRSRKLRYSTLARVEQQTEEVRKEDKLRREEFTKSYDDAVKKAKEEREAAIKVITKRVEDLQEKQKRGEEISVDLLMRIMNEQQEMQKTLQARAEQEESRLKRRRDNEIEKSRRDYQQRIDSIQFFYKAVAVLLPPIPPILVALVVFAWRRLREREGIARARLK